MIANVTIDQAGRIVLPKAIRDRLNLSAGDTLDLTLEGEHLTLEPHRTVAPLQKERGVWVFRTGQPLTGQETNDVLREIRERRGSERD